jgi:hypothetical protein
VRHFRVFAALVLATGLPAAAHTFGFPRSSQQACLAIGNATWRFATSTAADVRVRIDPTAAAATLRIRLAETSEDADFVLVDDGAPPDCRAAQNVKAVSIAPADGPADLVVAFTTGSASADYRLYVRSRWIAPEIAAALFAAANMPPQKVAGPLRSLELSEVR